MTVYVEEENLGDFLTQTKFLYDVIGMALVVSFNDKPITIKLYRIELNIIKTK